MSVLLSCLLGVASSHPVVLRTRLGRGLCRSATLRAVTGALLLLTSLSIVHDVDEMKQKLASVAFKLESQLSDVAHLEMPVSARV